VSKFLDAEAGKGTSFDIFSEHIEKAGFSGFEELVSAHVNTWANTAQALYNFHADNIKALDYTNMAYSRPDFEKELSDLRISSANSRDHFISQLDKSPDYSTKCCDINVHSPKQLNTHQLFEIAQQLPEKDQRQAFQILRHAGHTVHQVMESTVAFEDNLLKTLSPDRDHIKEEFGRDVVWPLNRNVEYHTEVAGNWKTLQNKAEAKLRPSNAQNAPHRSH